MGFYDIRPSFGGALGQATEIVSSVARSFLHTVRVGLYRRGVPYPALRRSKMVRFALDASWPQPSPISSKMPYAVLHLTAEEVREFLAKIVSRFERQVAISWISAASYLARRPHLDCPDDTTFTRYLTRSVYAYFLTDTLTATDLAILHENGICPERVRKNDLAPLSSVRPFEGLHITGSVVYSREAEDGSFEVLGIAMLDEDGRPGELLRPRDGNGWKRAKMHVLQGATYLSLFVTHPKCHFPMDALIAVTRGALPAEHPIAKLLEPHFYQQLPLDYSVLHIKNGPGYNDPSLYYTAFSGEGASQYRLFEVHYAGLPGHDVFPPHAFGGLMMTRRTEYLDFLLGYHELILAFVRKVVAHVEIDTHVTEWLRLCAHYARGFGPVADDDREGLARRMAMIIWNCSVVHSADHWEFFQIPMEHKPTRLRVPPPFDRRACSFEEPELTTVDDRLRHYMWHELYVKPHPLRRLSEVDYAFEAPDLQEENRELHRQLAHYASRWKDRYVPLEQICTSIQY